MERIISLLLLIVLMSVGVLAETFELPGCQGQAVVGINAQDPSGVYSPDCERVSDRILNCNCNESIELFDTEHNMKYDFHIDYYDDGIKKNKAFYDVSLHKTYVDMNSVHLIVYFVIGLLIVPLFFVFVVLFISKKIFGDKNK